MAVLFDMQGSFFPDSILFLGPEGCPKKSVGKAGSTQTFMQSRD
jgi:hypothetical protein